MTAVCHDEPVPVLVTTELRRESIVILSPGGLAREAADVVGAELDRLKGCRSVIVDLTGCSATAGRTLVVSVRARMPVGADLAVVCASSSLLEALESSLLSRCLECYPRLEDGLAAARLERASDPAPDSVRRERRAPGLRVVDREPCYSADWL